MCELKERSVVGFETVEGEGEEGGKDELELTILVVCSLTRSEQIQLQRLLARPPIPPNPPLTREQAISRINSQVRSSPLPNASLPNSPLVPPSLSLLSSLLARSSRSHSLKNSSTQTTSSTTPLPSPPSLNPSPTSFALGDASPNPSPVGGGAGFVLPWVCSGLLGCWRDEGRELTGGGRTREEEERVGRGGSRRRRLS